MKERITLLLVFCFSFSSYAQEASDSTKRRSKLEEPVQLRIRLGEALARDDFGDRIGRNEEAALAKNGLSFGVVVQAPIFKYLDFTADVSTASYDTETAALKAFAISQAPDFSWEISAGSYDVRNIFLGLNFYLGNRFRVFFNPYYGVSWMRLPKIRVDGQREETDKTITNIYSETRYENIRNLTFNFKGGIDYMITKTLGIHYTLEQIEYEIKTDAFVEVLDVNGDQGLTRVEAESTFSTLNHHLGIIVKLY